MIARTRVTLFAAVAAAMLLLGGATAGAATKSSKTSLTVDTITAVDEIDTIFALGDLDSAKSVCVGNRKVRIDLLPVDGKPVPFDVARSSERGGGWMGSHSIDEIVDAGPYDAARVKTAKVTRRVGKHKTIVCKAAKTVYPLED